MSLKLRIRCLFLSAVTGVLAGTASTLFLYCLAWATQTREANSHMIWALPLAGLLIGWVYRDYGKDVAAGNNLIIDEIHDPRKTVPLRMTPLILFSTVLTHLFGGSAGREGTAVQMGGSLADQLARRFGVSPDERRRLLMAGAGAGFGAAIGTPIAGAIFGIEMIHVKKLNAVGLAESTIASLAGYWTSRWLAAPHTVFPRIEIPRVEFNDFIFVMLAGLAFGLAARGFIWTTHAVERMQAAWIKRPELRPLAGGALLALLYWWEHSLRFAGLGLSVIQQAFDEPASARDSLLKALFTALTIGSGFKGGEFIPLVFIGTTLGSALSAVLPVSFQLLGAVGFSATFGAAANTPLACAVMAMEIFGWSLAPYALASGFMAYLVSGQRGIYKSQR